MTTLLIDRAWRRFRRAFEPLLRLAELRATVSWSRRAEVARAQGIRPERVRDARRAVPVPSGAPLDVLEYHYGLRQGADAIGAQLRTVGGSEWLRALPKALGPAKPDCGLLPFATRVAEQWTSLADSTVFFASWRQEKRLYRLTSELADGLRRARWPGAYPTAHLLPPARAVAIEVPVEHGDEGVVTRTRTLTAHLNVSLWDPDPSALSLWVMEAVQGPDGSAPDRLTPIAVIDLTAPTLDEAFERTQARTAKEQAHAAAKTGLVAPTALAPQAKVGLILPEAHRDGDLRMIINALLYIAGSDDVVREVVPGQPGRRGPAPRGEKKPEARMPAKSEAERRAVDLAAVRVHEVGVSYAHAVRRYIRDLEQSGSSSPGGEGASGLPSGRTVRPHIRAPHAHLYWTGPGRATPLVKFIAPVYVRGGVDDGSEAPAPRLRVVS